jgi:UDP-GlcNAc:undecaprenyl-phosphate GlcNAc-1-phosphate transferase
MTFGNAAIAFAVATAVSFLVTPKVITLARRVGAIDAPDARKAHLVPVPRLGGLGIALGFVSGVGILFALEPAIARTVFHRDEAWLVFGAMVGMLLLGVWDDIKSLGAGKKFLIQVVLATAVYAGGVSISAVTHPLGKDMLTLGGLDYIFTILWIVGITNAINLIDGLDGLASGVSVIAALTIFPLALLRGDTATAMIAVLLAGGIIGFLRYNFNPARIFMGDSGSLFLGFSLAILSIQSATKSSTVFAIVVPVLALGVPIMDTLLAMTRRLLRHLNLGSSGHGLLRAVATPDKAHIHHQLIALGFTHRDSVLTLYAISLVLGAGAFAITFANSLVASAVLAVVGLAAIIGVRNLQYSEMAVLENGMLLRIYDWHIVNSDTFKLFLDVVFIGGSFVATTALLQPGVVASISPTTGILTVSVVCGAQLLVFWLTNLYDGSLRHASLAESLRILQSVAVAVGITGAVLQFMPQAAVRPDFLHLVLNFYILLSLVLGTRLSFRVLQHYFHSAPREGTRILVYGTGMDGSHFVECLNHGDRTRVPVGFISDDPAQEGKTIEGLPVLGGHWKLDRLVRKLAIGEVVIAGENIRPEVLRRLRETTRNNGIPLRRYSWSVQNLPGGNIASVPSTETIAMPLPESTPRR